mgnify:CR=1 FL=1
MTTDSTRQKPGGEYETFTLPYGDDLFAPRRSTADLSGLHVLLVEDDDDARELLIEVLSKFGCRVNSASSVPDAMAQFAEAPPDMVVSDIGMPREDGYALLRTIRARNAAEGGTVPAIALTAYTAERDKRLARDAGFDAHLAKPVNVRELVDMVGAVVQQARA